MAAQAVRYMNGQSKSLTKSLLSKLFKGQAHLSIMPYDTANGVTWANLSFSGADELFTIKDSFQISQADSSATEIKIDQKDEVIDTITTKGEWTFAGNIPAIAASMLNVFYTQGASVAGQTSPILGQAGTTYGAQAYFSTPKSVYATILVENDNEDLGIAFARVKMTVGLSNDDNSNPAYLKLSATILSNTESAGTQGDWALCEKYSAS